MVKKVLVVEDNQDLADLVSMHLRDMEVEVTLAHDGEQGLRTAQATQFDLIILDLMLPKLDGLEVCRQLRQLPIYVPILMLTAKSTEMDRVLGLEIGADDYLTKPFSIRELLARVKAIFRRVDAFDKTNSQLDSSDTIRCGKLMIDRDSRKVILDGKEISLTAKEFDLLWFFASQPGRVFSRMQLLDSVWGYGHDGYEHTVNSHMNRLRSKIELDPTRPEYIQTVWGVGYKFRSDDPSVAES